jgi:hypothetical protein
MDREESKKTSDRERDLHERLAAEGRFSGGPRPFGYEPDGVTLVEKEAELVRRAACRFLAGEALYAICRDWNDAGIPTAYGGEWQPTSLRRLLRSPRLAGLRQRGTDDETGMPVIVGPAVWKPILDRATWERVEAKLRPTRLRQRPNRYLLSGVIRCGRCGSRMYGNAPKSKGVLMPARYACLAQPGRPSCGSCAVMVAAVDERVVSKLLDYIQSPAWAKVLRRDRGINRDSDRAEVDLVDAETRLLELAEEFGAGQLSRAQWLAMKKGAERRLEAAKAKVVSVQRQAVVTELDDVDTLRDRWPKMSQNRRRAVIAAVVESVTVAPVGKGWRRREGQANANRVSIAWRA